MGADEVNCAIPCFASLVAALLFAVAWWRKLGQFQKEKERHLEAWSLYQGAQILLASAHAINCKCSGEWNPLDPDFPWDERCKDLHNKRLHCMEVHERWKRS